MTEKHGPKILNSLDKLEKRRNKLLKLGTEMLSAYGGALYPVDLLALGAIKRSISTAAAFRLLIESFNMVCARSLLRMQIDTALRFFAVFLVKEPHDFAIQVLNGQQINQLKDQDGKKMMDAYLVSKLAHDYPWLRDVYKNLSGYVHFSNHHLFAPVQQVNNDSRSIQFEISEKDVKFPEFSWLEAIDCFNESTDIFIKYLEGWIFTKANPEVVAKIKEKLKS